MAALKEKGIALLGTATIDVKTAATTTIFTTPPGKVTRISEVCVRDPTASLAGGTSYSITNFVQTFSLANLTTANTAYCWIYPTSGAVYIEIAASTAVQLTVTTGSTAAANATFDVFGYLT